MRRLALALLVLSLTTATHAHRPPIGANSALVVDDGCAPSPMEIEHYNAFNALWNGDDYREPFTLGPVQEGVTTRFGTASQSVFRSGRARITIRLDDAYGWDRKRTFRIAARSLASLPGALLQRVPTATTLDLTEFRSDTLPEGAAYAWGPVCSHSEADGRDCSYHVVVPRNRFELNDDGLRPVPRPHFEGTLVHEFAHVLDMVSGILPWLNGTCDGGTDSPCPPWWSDSEEWQAAIADSACAVSAFATTNASEDFAESIMAWFGYYAGRQGRLEPELRDALRERLGERWPLIVKYMHARFDDGE